VRPFLELPVGSEGVIFIRPEEVEVFVSSGNEVSGFMVAMMTKSGIRYDLGVFEDLEQSRSKIKHYLSLMEMQLN
jgi:hypothetical protein